PRAAQQQVAVRHAMGSLEEHPGAVAAAQVAQQQRVVLPGDRGVQRREEYVFRKPDVAVLATDGGVRGAALEALHGGAAVVEQHQDDGWRGSGGGTSCRRGGPAPGSPLDERRAAGGAELGPRRDRDRKSTRLNSS